MVVPSGFRRLLAVTTAVALVLPAAPAPAQDVTDQAPPSRVGQISALRGSVSFNGAGSGGWADASLNYPVSAGDALYAQVGGQAVITVDASRIVLAQGTELQMTALTDSQVAATESQGELFLDVNDLQPGESYEVATPRGTVTIAQDGKYDIQAGDQDTPTMVSVFYGAATVTDPGATIQVPAGQEAVLSGTDQTVAQLAQAAPDAFAQLELSFAVPPPPSYAPPVVSEMTGGYELSRYGDWGQDPDYGAIWYPNVNAGWAPYREGYWADIAPWGWTWVDNDPWGFAPFHYGRWIDRGGRWGWIPADRDAYGERDRPIYAPAVVGFFGLGVAVGLSVAGLSGRPVGWVPLGPGEPFRPYYRTNVDYDRRINQFNVRNFRGDGAEVTPDHFVNRSAATYLPADAMGKHDPVARFGRPVPEGALAAARPLGGRLDDGAPVVLPHEAAPLALVHPGAAPHPTLFGERHDLPPAVISHEPVHPAGLAPEVHPPFGGNPGFHPPPPPPGGHYTEPPPPGHEPTVFTNGAPNGPAYRLPPPHEPPPAMFRPEAPAPMIHPQGETRPLPQVYRPQPPAPPQFRPPPSAPDAFRPPAPEVFHPPAPEFHPPAPEFRPPPAPEFHPPPAAFHPPAPQPAPPPPPPHAEPPPGNGKHLLPGQ